MFSIQITGLEGLRAELAQFSDRRFAATVATALTRTAVHVRGAVQAEASRSLDRPTPYTMRQLRYVAATAARPVAAVGFNVAAVQDVFGRVVRYESLAPGSTPAGKYLQHQVDGGQRGLKRMEVALKAAGALPEGYVTVPGQGARTDAYGNVSKGQVIQVLSQLRLQLVAGTNRSMSRDARRQIAAQRKAGGRFFVAPVGGKLQPGIYQREFIGVSITPVFIFVKSARYSRRFDFYGAANRAADAVLDAQLRRAVDESAARMGQPS
jgi:hypothetical protein